MIMNRGGMLPSIRHARVPATPVTDSGGGYQGGEDGERGRHGHAGVVSAGETLGVGSQGDSSGNGGRDTGDDGENYSPAHLLRGADEPGGYSREPWLDAAGCGGIHGGEAHSVADWHDQQSRQDVQDVAAVDRQETKPGHAGGHNDGAGDEKRPEPEPGHEPGHPGGSETKNDGERHEGQAGPDGRVSLDTLQVKGHQEEHGQVPAVNGGHHDAGTGDVAYAEDRQRHDRTFLVSLVDDEARDQHCGGRERPEGTDVTPAPGGGLREAEHDGHQR